MLALAIGLLGAFALLELGLRFSNAVPEVANPLYSFHEPDALLGWRGKRDVRQRFHRPDFDVLIEHDGEGWRRKVPPAPAAPKRRILFLGDSFTWGWGVGQGEVFTDRLQAAVGPEVEIVNRGVNAFGTAQELLLLEQELAKAHYDRVVVVMCGNDLEDNLDPRGGKRPGWRLAEDGSLVAVNQPARRLMSPVKQFVESHSRAVLFVAFLLNDLKRAAPRDEVVAWSIDPARAAEADALGLRLLGELQERVRAHGADWRLVPVPMPDPEHPGAFAMGPDMERFLAQVERELGVPTVSLLEPANAAVASGTAIKFAHDNHWTVAGHRLVAETLLAAGVCAFP